MLSDDNLCDVNPFPVTSLHLRIPDIKSTKYFQNIFIFVKQESRPKIDHMMSDHCPLCGKEKKGEALFCEACTKKLRTEYELVLPQPLLHQPLPSTERPTDVDVDSFIGAVSTQAPEEMPSEESTDATGEETKRPFAASDTAVAGATGTGSRKTGRRGVSIATSILLLLLLFFLYNELIRKGNLERSGWDSAVKSNSVPGYLDYIESHPDGAHFADAQAALMRLKAEEADRWEVLKQSDRVTELRDFLLQFPESHYAPLVRRRLDSLTWMGTLHSNTATAYSDYLMMVESGDFNGDYLAEAESRYRMLFQSYPVDQHTLDSIRIVVNGFCSAISLLDHSDLEQWLAPRVERYFFKGPLARERLLGDLLVAAAQSNEPQIIYTPDLDGIQYEKTMEDHYRVNLPIVKSRNGAGIRDQLPGYIFHLELNPHFQITSVYETKPYPGAP